jgi:hypothetical protein
VSDGPFRRLAVNGGSDEDHSLTFENSDGFWETGVYSSSDDSLFDDEDEEIAAVLAVVTAAAQSLRCFSANELASDSQQSVNKDVGVRDVLATMKATPSLFRSLTNFTVEEFELLCQRVAPVIATHARSSGVLKIQGRHPKLSAHQRLLAFILHLKHDNSAMMEAFSWNWSKSSVSDDAIFVASCINHSLEDEIRWPSAAERDRLGAMIPEFPRCIGFIDGTLCKIRRPHNDDLATVWFNGRKKIYAVNNTVIIDHDGLFIYVDCGYPGSYHDVNILRQSELHRNWRAYFRHNDVVKEYVLGDPGYQGEEMYIMPRIRHREVPEDTNMHAIDAYNKMHAGYRIKVEWGICDLKRKWKRMSKTKQKFPHLFRAAALLTNFLHRRRMDMQAEIEGRYDDEDEIGWLGDQ